MSDTNRPLIRPFEKFLFLVGLALFALIYIQNKTGKVVQTVENEDFTKGFYSNLMPPENIKTDPLPSIANIFSEKQRQDEPDFWKELRLSEGEKDFFKSLRNRHKTDLADVEKPAQNWLNTLQSARLTYGKVADIFQAIDPEGKHLTPEKWMSAVLSDSLKSEFAFLQIEQLFKIPREDARSFAREGNESLTDWALFVEEKQQ
jgi:hypothetical protein